MFQAFWHQALENKLPRHMKELSYRRDHAVSEHRFDQEIYPKRLPYSTERTPLDLVDKSFPQLLVERLLQSARSNLWHPTALCNSRQHHKFANHVSNLAARGRSFLSHAFGNGLTH